MTLPATGPAVRDRHAPSAAGGPAVLPPCPRPSATIGAAVRIEEPRRIDRPDRIEEPDLVEAGSPVPGAPTVRRMCSVPVGRRAPRRAPDPPPPRPVPAPPDAGPAVVAALRTALEVLDRRRPATQLDALFSASARRYWLAERDRTTGPARLVRLRLDGSAADVGGGVEVAAVCAFGARVRAVAARFDPYQGGWRCTTVRLL